MSHVIDHLPITKEMRLEFNTACNSTLRKTKFKLIDTKWFSKYLETNLHLHEENFFLFQINNQSVNIKFNIDFTFNSSVNNNYNKSYYVSMDVVLHRGWCREVFIRITLRNICFSKKGKKCRFILEGKKAPVAATLWLR